METPEEKLAIWADPSVTRPQSLTALKGSIPLNSNHLDKRVRIAEGRVPSDQIGDHLLKTKSNNISDEDDPSNLWHFKETSFPRLRRGRLVLSFPRQVFQQIQDSWNLHPRTIEVFLSNSGVFTPFHSSSSARSVLLLKVANSRATGSDCVSVTRDPSRRTTYAVYHHLEDEDSLFATLSFTPERCVDAHFFVAVLYRSHYQHIETHRNAIDDVIIGIEEQTSFEFSGKLMGFERRASLDENLILADSRSTIQQLSYCQTDLAIVEHVARCCLEFGEWLVQALEETLVSEYPQDDGRTWRNGFEPQDCDPQSLKSLRAVRLMIGQDVEYKRRQTVLLLSQVQQLKDRVQSQITLVSNIGRELHYNGTANKSS